MNMETGKIEANVGFDYKIPEDWIYAFRDPSIDVEKMTKEEQENFLKFAIIRIRHDELEKLYAEQWGIFEDMKKGNRKYGSENRSYEEQNKLVLAIDQKLKDMTEKARPYFNNISENLKQEHL